MKPIGVVLFLVLIVSCNLFDDIEYKEFDPDNCIQNEEFKCGDTLVDCRDGKKYKTIEIGGQCWFQVNLNVGDVIITDFAEVRANNDIIEKFCHDNDPDCSKFGGFYVWEEANLFEDSVGVGICPKGWRIPSREDFSELIEIADPNSLLFSPGVDLGFQARKLGFVRFTQATVFCDSFKATFWSSDKSDTSLIRGYVLEIRDVPKVRDDEFYCQIDHAHCIRCVME